MNTFIKKYIKKSGLCLALALPLAATLTTSCSDEHMAGVNTDPSKSEKIDPNNQLTTGLLQTYGDFSLMDTYRSYITGFTQHFAGGWNVSNYAGSVHFNDDQARLIWDRYYTVAIKNLVDAIANSQDQPNLNAALRIHRVYLMSVLTDTYGDIPCMDAGKGYTEGISNPKYDTQEAIYDWFFTELKACVNQLDAEHGGKITGDVTSLAGEPVLWARYANSLRERFAMRISDVNAAKAKEEFEAAVNDSHGDLQGDDVDAYVIYSDNSFTLYKGAEDYDFRVNALGEILYGQDPTSPTFVCSTLFEQLKNTNDPRLYRICRHYINTKRSEVKPDREGNHDFTNDVVDYLSRINQQEAPCDPGAAWYDNWVNPPALSDIPSLEKLVNSDPAAGYNGNNFDARMMRPALNIDFEMPDRPGFLITRAELDFLKAEAITKGWTVPAVGNASTAEGFYEDGIRMSMAILNDHYLTSNKITNDEVDAFIAKNKLSENAKMSINTQAWILHMMNPAEAWANLRRSDYPVIKDRAQLKKFDGYTYDDANLETPTRLRYPILEGKYNTENYNEALSRMGGSDNWHQRLWWDTANIHVK